MRIRVKNSWWSVALLATLCVLGGAVARAHAVGTPSTSGITLTPATLTLTLGHEQQAASQAFSVTNHYSVPVTLRFTVLRSGANIKTPLDAATLLAVANDSLTIPSGQTAKQTITLHDDPKLAPGSQQATLQVSEINDSGSQVHIAGAMQMPIITVKQDGALMRIGQGSVQTPRMAWQLPGSIEVTVHNTGNMIAIPHGYLTVAAPNGHIVQRGVVNIASAAIAPGGRATLQTSLTQLRSVRWPGMYRVDFYYGLGSGQAGSVATARFLYIAWWHVALLIVLAVAAVFGVRLLLQTVDRVALQHKRPNSRTIKKEAT
ncbi:MAG TPA: hypothetical protein VJP80_02665 [Candidatus Saccharimonadales bacterium]|nr:hypothetical protein [Candidatus Saccharimonadales bacterium]